jgi:hypothetical protein
MKQEDVKQGVHRFQTILVIALLLLAPLRAFSVNAIPAPGVGTLENTYVSSSVIRINWSAVGDQNTRYVVYRDGVQLAEVTESEYLDTVLDSNRNYYYRVAALNSSDDEGTQSPELRVRTKGTDEAPLISDISVSETAQGMTVFFSTDEQSYGSVSYWRTAETPVETGFAYDDQYQTEYEVPLSDLQQGSTYFFSIEACNDDGNCMESPQAYFVYGDDGTPPTVSELQCPTISSERLISVGGTTEPLSTIEVLMNGDSKFSYSVPLTGYVAIDNIPLTSQETTVITLRVTDTSGNTEDKICTVAFDGSPPAITINDFPEITNAGSVPLVINTSEPVTLTITRVTSDDVFVPQVPESFTATVESNLVRLSWEKTNDTDVDEYVIYRDNTPIAHTSGLQYEDTQISSGVTYEYRVRAVDESCNLGGATGIQYATIPSGTIFNPQPQELSSLCFQSPALTQDISTSYSGDLTLREGQNKIEILAEDNAGNTWSHTYAILYDKTRPRLETNLDDYLGTGEDDGVYFTEIIISGEVSEYSEINITVNEDDEYLFSADGAFQKKIELSREIQVNIDQDSSDIYSGMRWPNDISITATDIAGNSVSEEGQVLYRLCAGGDGFDWEVDFPRDSFVPSELVPRHLIEGLGVIGFAYELTYRQDGDMPTITDINLNTAPMSPFHQQRYDEEWIDGQPNVMYSDLDPTYGYVQINMIPVDITGGEEMTLLEQENLLAENHQGSCLGAELTFGVDTSELSPDLIGCVKFPLVFEIIYENPNGEGTLTQKECIETSTMITPRLDTNKWKPTLLLEAGATAANWISETAAELREYTRPLAVKATKWCMYSFLGSAAATLGESASCIMNGAILQYNNFYYKIEDGEYVMYSFDGDVPYTAMESDMREKADKLKSCVEAKGFKEELWRLSKYVCKRAMCGSTPSFDSYVAKNAGTVQAIDIDEEEPNEGDLRRAFSQKLSYCSNMGSNLYTYEPEALTGDEQQFLETMLESESLTGDFSATDKIMANFLGEDGHPLATQMTEWCEEEYMYEYQSSCPFRNAYKDSVCVYATLHRNELSEGLGAVQGTQLETLYEDMCVSVDIIGSIKQAAKKLQFCKADEQNTYILNSEGHWYLIRKENSVDATGTTVNEAQAWLLREDSMISIDPDQRYVYEEDLDEPIDVEDRRGQEITDQFEDTTCTVSTSGGETITKSGNDACLECAAGLIGDPCCAIVDGVQVPPGVATHVCDPTAVDPDEAPIIDPAGSLVNSFECLCFTAIDAYLAKLETIFGMIGDCFTTILETGEGDAGMCQQVLTVYICDVIFWAFDCFTSYGSVGAGVPTNDGLTLQNIGSALAMAGQSIENDINGEYGDNALFRQLFVERKVMNAVCLFAFTGDWPANFFEEAIEAAVDESVPVEPFIACSANRRFQTFNSVTGIATYIYDVAPYIYSGASDTTYNIKLVCSTDAGDDCSAVGEEKWFDVTNKFGNGRLGKNDELNIQDFVVVDETQDSSNRGRYRYDAVRVSVQYTNNEGNTVNREQECNIPERGGEPPAFCSFDIFTAGGEPYFSCQIIAEEGTAYFVDVPTPKQERIYTQSDDLSIAFNTYTIRREIPTHSEEGRDVYLRISAEDNLGQPIDWYNDESIAQFPIQEGLNMFGEGSNVAANDIPRLSRSIVAELDGITNDQYGCRVRMDSGRRKESVDCSGFFSALEVSQDGDTFILKEGTYTNNRFEASVNEADITQYVSDEVGGHRSIVIPEGYLGLNGRELSFEVTDVRSNSYPFVLINKRGTDGSAWIDFTFDLITDQGNVISHNLESQSRTVRVTVVEGTPEDDTENQGSTLICSHNGITTGPSCYCGAEPCSTGERCCRATNMISGVGYCIPEEYASAECDAIPPEVDGELEITAELQSNGLISFVFSNVQDESQSLRGASPSMSAFVDVTHTGFAQDSEDVTTSFVRGNINPTLNAEQQAYSIAYDDVNVVALLEQEGCYDLEFSLVDKAGNQNSNVKSGSIMKCDDDTYSTFLDSTCLARSHTENMDCDQELGVTSTPDEESAIDTTGTGEGDTSPSPSTGGVQLTEGDTTPVPEAEPEIETIFIQGGSAQLKSNTPPYPLYVDLLYDQVIKFERKPNIDEGDFFGITMYGCMSQGYVSESVTTDVANVRVGEGISNAAIGRIVGNVPVTIDSNECGAWAGISVTGHVHQDYIVEAEPSSYVDASQFK